MPDVVRSSIQRQRPAPRRCLVFQEFHIRRFDRWPYACNANPRAEQIVQTLLRTTGVQTLAKYLHTQQISVKFQARLGIANCYGGMVNS